MMSLCTNKGFMWRQRTDAHRVQHSHFRASCFRLVDFRRRLLTHALALFASHFFHARKSPCEHEYDDIGRIQTRLMDLLIVGTRFTYYYDIYSTCMLSYNESLVRSIHGEKQDNVGHPHHGGLIVQEILREHRDMKNKSWYINHEDVPGIVSTLEKMKNSCTTIPIDIIPERYVQTMWSKTVKQSTGCKPNSRNSSR